MNYDVVADYRLQRVYKSLIAKSSRADRFLLRSGYNCGHRATNEQVGVAIIANSRHSRVVGAKMCNNAWACPVCSAFKMSKYAARVAAAIDALQKQNLVPIMITFTIFHSKNDSCEQAFNLLFDTWTRFKSGCRNDGVYSNFLRDCEIKHYVRCAEVTYTENGWHPHLHCLYWLPKNKLQKAAECETKLRATWRETEKKVMKKIFGYVKDYAFVVSEELHGEGAAGVYISKDSNGRPIIQKTSDYICGWGADKEVTGNYKKEATNPNSLTPTQMLKKAEDGDDQMAKLYIEFARYVVYYKRRRVDFSRTGLNAIIANYMNSEGYKTVMKKKRTQYLEDAGAWHLVAWFSKKLWFEVCNHELPLVPMMLCFAKYSNGYDLIAELLAVNHFKEMPAAFDPEGYHNEFVKMISEAA